MPSIKNSSQKVRFLLVGGTSTIIDFGLLFFAASAGTPVLMANIISTGVAFCFSFLANKNYTFKTHGTNLKREISLFVIVTLFGLWVIQTVIIGAATPVIAIATTNSNIQLLIAKFLATVATTIWNYVLYSRVVFLHKN